VNSSDFSADVISSMDRLRKITVDLFGVEVAFRGRLALVANLAFRTGLDIVLAEEWRSIVENGSTRRSELIGKYSSSDVGSSSEES
jgi:hypothetical protein